MASTKTEICREQWMRYYRARERGHRDYMQQATVQNSYYVNEQWNPDDLKKLREEERPALTLNLFTSTINTILGEQIARSATVQFRPRRGGDQDTADTLAKIYMQIADENNLEDVEADVFADSMIMDGRGFFDVRIDFEDHVFGEVRISSLDPLDVVIDPDAKTDDPAEWTEVFTSRWLTLDELEMAYGKAKARQVKEMGGQGAPDWRNLTGLDLYRYEHTFGKSESMPVMGNEARSESKRIRTYHVIERQYRKPVRADVFVDPLHGDVRAVPNAWGDERALKFATANGYVLTKRTVRKVRWTVTCGTVVLHDAWSPYQEFTVIPCFAFFRRGTPFGLGRLLLSPQDQLNKTYSQMLHVINTTANSGWVTDENALVNMEPEDLEEQGAKTGLVLVKRPGSELEKIQPNIIPQGLDRFSMSAAAMLKEISGVSDAQRGTADPEVSGVALETAQARGSVMLQVPLANLKRARMRLAARVLELVQTFYSEARIVMVTNEDDPLKPKEPMPINQPTPEGSLLNDITVGEYDVIMTLGPARDSFDEMQFGEALSLRSAGVAIPDDAIVEYSHLARKEQLAKRMRQASGEEPTPEQAEAARKRAEYEERLMELAIGKEEAEIKKIAADVQLIAAKAGVELSKEDMEILKEINKRDIAAGGDKLRRELAHLSADTQREVSENAAASKIAGQAMAGSIQERVARISARASERQKETTGSSDG